MAGVRPNLDFSVNCSLSHQPTILDLDSSNASRFVVERPPIENREKDYNRAFKVQEPCNQ